MILFYLIVVVLNFKALEERNNPMDTKLVIQAKKHDKEAFVKLIEDNQASMYKAAIAILQMTRMLRTRYRKRFLSAGKRLVLCDTPDILKRG